MFVTAEEAAVVKEGTLGLTTSSIVDTGAFTTKMSGSRDGDITRLKGSSISGFCNWEINYNQASRGLTQSNKNSKSVH